MDHSIRAVDRWVDQICRQHVNKFYPTAVSKATDLPLNQVFLRLLRLVDDEVLRIQWEIRCPNYVCMRTVETLTAPSDMFGTWMLCEYCGNEFEVTPEVIFPVFYVDSGYRDYIRSSMESIESKKNNQSHKVPVTNVLVDGTEPAPLSKLLTPDMLEHLQRMGYPQYIVNLAPGGVSVANYSRTISNSFNNATMHDNTNVMGDNITQSLNAGMDEDVFEQLMAEINKLENDDDRELAASDAKQLQDAIKNKNMERARKIFGRLPEIIRATECGLTIAKMIGWVHGVPS